jgi:hypothetical protein
MISRKEYLSAKLTVERYELQQEKLRLSMDECKVKFPIGCFVISKLNTAVRGTVYDYTDWDGTTQLLCHKEDCGKTRILVTNAVVTFPVRFACEVK